MPEKEYNFSPEQLDLIEEGDGLQPTHYFDPVSGDYLRMSVFDENGDQILEAYSNITHDGSLVEFEYETPDTDQTIINETGILSSEVEFEDIDSGTCSAIDRDEEICVGYDYGACINEPGTCEWSSTLNDKPILIPITDLSSYSLVISQLCEQLEGYKHPDYHNVVTTDMQDEILTTVAVDTDISNSYVWGGNNWVTTTDSVAPENTYFYLTELHCMETVGVPDFPGEWHYTDVNQEPQVPVYVNQSTGKIYTKPNEILERYEVPTGNYELRFDFLHDFCDDPYGPSCNSTQNPRFIVKQISPTRKEIRVITSTSPPGLLPMNQSFIDVFTGRLGYVDYEQYATDDTVTNTYEFDWIVGLPESRNVPIVNWAFDYFSETNADVTTGQGVSLILKLNEQLPPDIQRLSEINISQEVYTTQINQVFYVSNILPYGTGDGLERDGVESGIIQYEYSDDTPQSYNELYGSASTDSLTLDTISQKLANADVNLNIDYNDFANHTLFGSAKQKIINFKDKVTEIDGYLHEISKSLANSSGSQIHVINLRTEYFEKIRGIKDKLTPYEKFLYSDNQSISSASAPGIGKNYALETPVTMSVFDNATSVKTGFKLVNHDGFDIVYKHSNENLVGSTGTVDEIPLFNNLYRVENAPFFNYTGSVYLSFLLKATSSLGSLNHDNYNGSQGALATYDGIPTAAMSKHFIEQPTITGSDYRQFIIVASQSYWTRTPNNPGDPVDVSSPEHVNSSYILSGSNITGSEVVYDSTGLIPLYPTLYDDAGNIDNTTPRTGSVLPSGELFRVNYDANNEAITSSFMTDVKITLNNPSGTLPFGTLYQTGSNEWSDWYDDIYTSAETFDNDNIHSLVNNLPETFKEESDSELFKKFLNMLGENYDLMRNYITNYSKFYSRKYNKLDAVPGNLMPILAENLGWELINPYSSSLAGYYKESQGGEELTENTWRKVLNNLIYIYKTKGTLSSLRGLLNIYGYPPDVINMIEYGGTNQDMNPAIITDDAQRLLEGLSGKSGNVAFTNRKSQYRLLNFRDGRTIELDWWMNGVNAEALEFVFSSIKGNVNQTIVESSGSANQTLWDLGLTTGTNNVSGSLQFRLNGSNTGSLSMVGNALSMSTAELPLKNNRLWNVLLQRMTSSISGSGIQEYRLHTGYQTRNDVIKYLSVVSMSVSGGATPDKNYYANQNWQSSGSRHPLSASNLIFGETFTGSLSEIRTWNTPLSMSRFKQHILNKESLVGNNITASKSEIIYRFRLNENTPSGSLISIKDANSSNIKDYSRDTSIYDANYFGVREIDEVKLTPRMGGLEQQNKNKIIHNVPKRMVSDLHPTRESFVNLDDETENKRIQSREIHIGRSIQDVINDYIINNLGDYDISGYFADPANIDKDEYPELKKLREDLLSDVSVDINKWNEAQSNIFNTAVLHNLGKILPASVKPTGITFKPDLLERTKIKSMRVTKHTGSAAGYYEMDLGRIPEITYDFTGSNLHVPYKLSITGSNDNTVSGSYEQLPFGIITGSTDNTVSGSYYQPHEVSSSIVSYVNITSSYNPEYYTSSIINLTNQYSMSMGLGSDTLGGAVSKNDFYPIFKLPYTASNFYTLTSSYNPNYYTSSIINITTQHSMSMINDWGEYNVPFTASDFYTLTSSYYQPHEASNNITGYVNITSSYNPNYYTSSIINIPNQYSMSVNESWDPYNLSYTASDFYTLTSSYEQPYEKTIYTSNYSDVTASYIPTHITFLSGSEFIGITSEYSPEDAEGTMQFVKVSEITSGETYLISSSYEVPHTIDIDYNNMVSHSSQYNHRLYEMYITNSSDNRFAPHMAFSMTQSGQVTSNDKLTRGLYDLEFSLADSSEDLHAFSSSIEWILPYTGSTSEIRDANLQRKFLWKDESVENLNGPGKGDYHILPSRRRYYYPDENGISEYWGNINDTNTFHPFYEVGHPKHPQGNSGSGDYNTGYIEREMVHELIGDVEIIKGNEIKKQYDNYLLRNKMAQYNEIDRDYTDYKKFHNRQIKNVGEGYLYNTYRSGSNGPQIDKLDDGRPLGRTAYFTTSSDGTIVYPVNHYIYNPTSKQSIRFLTYEGTKNVSGSITNLSEYSSVEYIMGGVIDHGEHDLFPLIPFYTECIEENWTCEGEDTPTDDFTIN